MAADTQKIESLANDITRLSRDLISVVREVTVEPPPRELAPLIVQLADVEREIEEHFKRYPHGRPKVVDGHYGCENEKRDWSVLCRRKDTIHRALARYAMAATQPRESAISVVAAANDGAL